jgi:hypothetical protein
MSAIEGLLDQSANGDATTQFSLGELYFAGEGVELDQLTAVFYWTKAAEGSVIKKVMGFPKMKKKHSIGLAALELMDIFLLPTKRLKLKKGKRLTVFKEIFLIILQLWRFKN